MKGIHGQGSKSWSHQIAGIFARIMCPEMVVLTNHPRMICLVSEIILRRDAHTSLYVDKPYTKVVNYLALPLTHSPISFWHQSTCNTSTSATQRTGRSLWQEAPTALAWFPERPENQAVPSGWHITAIIPAVVIIDHNEQGQYWFTFIIN